MKIISFILNLPYTLIGLMVAVFSIPKNIKYNKNPTVFIVRIKHWWWAIGYMKNARAAIIGHVVFLGDKTEPQDLEHELIHVKQLERLPIIYPILYLFELLLKGYKNNKFEVEAYKLAGNMYRGK